MRALIASNVYSIVLNVLVCMALIGCVATMESAIQSGELSQVKDLLADGVDINKQGNSAYAPLEYAVKYNQYSIAEYLLEHGAQPKSIYLFEYAQRNPDMVELLLKHGANPATPLVRAIEDGNLKLATLLLEFNVDPNKEGRGLRKKKMPLYAALEEGHIEFANELVQLGARSKVYLSSPATFCYSKELPIECIELLNVQPKKDDERVLMDIARHMLLKRIGMKIIEPNKDNTNLPHSERVRTAVVPAALGLSDKEQQRAIDYIRYLLEQGVDPNKLHFKGTRSARVNTSRYSDRLTFRKYEHRDGNIVSPTEGSISLLTFADKEDQQALVKLLQQYNAQ